MKKIFLIFAIIMMALSASVEAAQMDYHMSIEREVSISPIETVSSSLKKETAKVIGMTMANGQEGCTEAALMIGAKVSPVMAEAVKEGIVYNPNLIAFAQAHGVSVEDYNTMNLEAGDVILFGTPGDKEKHAMLYIGNGMMAGNNSYLYGKEGKGGIWTLKVTDYTYYNPQLVIKFSRTITGVQDRSDLFRLVGGVDTFIYTWNNEAGKDYVSMLAMVAVFALAARLGLAAKKASKKEETVAIPAAAPVVAVPVIEKVSENVMEDVVEEAAEDHEDLLEEVFFEEESAPVAVPEVITEDIAAEEEEISEEASSDKNIHNNIWTNVVMDIEAVIYDLQMTVSAKDPPPCKSVLDMT